MPRFVPFEVVLSPGSRCKRLVEVRKVRFEHAKRVGGL